MNAQPRNDEENDDSGNPGEEKLPIKALDYFGNSMCGINAKPLENRRLAQDVGDHYKKSSDEPEAVKTRNSCRSPGLPVSRSPGFPVFRFSGFPVRADLTNVSGALSNLEKVESGLVKVVHRTL